MNAIKYKKTGIDWMPEIPEHWNLLRVKNLFKEVDERSSTGNEELLSVSQFTGITPRKDALKEGEEITNARTLKGYKLVKEGDLVVNIMLAWNGSLGTSKFSGITSPAYCVYRVNPELNPHYFGYLFSTSLFKGEFRRNSTGIIESRLRLYTDRFFRIFSFVPTRHEQDEIVTTIERESAKIAHFVERKERFIELLKEQRQSIITHAVTKGIDPNAKLKPSGVDWLGDIPEHWEVRRLKNISRSIETGSTPKSEDAAIYMEYGDVNWFTPGDIKDIFLIKSKRKVTKKAIDDSAVKLFPAGAVLVVGIGATLGKLALLREPGGSNQQINAIVFDQDLMPEFGLYFLSSFESVLKSISNASTLAILTQSDLKGMLVAFPAISEQKKIVGYIRSETRLLNVAISKAEREIELMKEYREAMIAEAVTGTMKIPGN